MSRPVHGLPQSGSGAVGAPQAATSPDVQPLAHQLSQLLVHIRTLLFYLHDVSNSAAATSLEATGGSSTTTTTSAVGVPPYGDLVQRYSVVMSQVVGLGQVLAGRARDRDKWASHVVVPDVEAFGEGEVEVGRLLRTKQKVEVEGHLDALLRSLPAQFNPSRPDAGADTGNGQGDDRVVLGSAESDDALRERHAFVERCVQRVNELKKGQGGEEWEWKARMPPGERPDSDDDNDNEDDDVDEDEEGDDDDDRRASERSAKDQNGAGDAMQVDGTAEGGSGGAKEEADAATSVTRAWTIKEVAAFQRTGVVPF